MTSTSACRYFLLRVPPLRRGAKTGGCCWTTPCGRCTSRYGVAKRFSSSALELLATYDWPGNVRQLISVATMGYALSVGDVIEPPDFEEQIELRGRDPGDEDEDLYQRVVVAREDFWAVVHEPFMRRDLNRRQVRAFIRKGLAATKGSYADLIEHLNLPRDSYQEVHGLPAAQPAETGGLRRPSRGVPVACERKP